jgi:hypothetical protein
MKKFYFGLLLILSTNFLYAQLKPITDKGIFQSITKEVVSPDPTAPRYTIADLYVKLFGQTVEIKNLTQDFISSSLNAEDFDNGKIPDNVLDIVETVPDYEPFPTKYYIQKINEEYHVYSLVPYFEGEKFLKSKNLIKIIKKE